MGIEFLVPGTAEAPHATRAGGLAAAQGSFAVRHAVRVALQRGEQQWQRATAEPGQDIVVLKLAGGPELVLHPQTARALLEAQRAPAARGAARPAGSVLVPAGLAWDTTGSPPDHASRGDLSKVLLDGFQVLRRPLGGPAAALTADAVAARFDGQVLGGVHRLAAAALAPLEAATRLDMVPAPEPGARLLVLIHGTFSSTAGTFGKLWSAHPALVDRLFERYGDRIYALEHATLGLSPAENALALARALPEGAVLHLLTHSRGGLVAEVLARMCARPQLDGHAVSLFAGQPRDIDALRALAQVVQTRRLCVERIVRVACPARGTLLASRRLDAYLSVLRWCLTLAQVPVAPALLDFLQEVALQRLEPDRLPGLAAQLPDSPLTQWLHRAGEAIPGQLRVVAGDIEGDSLTSWLKTLASDAFYWTDNDLVVQTRSMYGGSPRADEAAFVLDAGGSVSHFAYFANERTASAAVRALLEDRPDGFRPIGPLSWSGSSSTGERAAAPGPVPITGASTRPVVVLLPGFGGSHLRAGGERRWLDGASGQGLQPLAWRPGQDGTVRPDGVVERSYGALLAALSPGHDVIAFDHDWRCPLEDEARRLADMLQRLCEAHRGSGQPVHLLAHGSGGLLARVMQLERPQVWQAWMDNPASRLLMLGTPHAGCWMPMQVLSGDDTLGHALDALDPYAGAAAARAVLAGFPGLLQIQQGLPDPDHELAHAERWAALAQQDLDALARSMPWHDTPLQRRCAAWGVPTQATLDAAVALRKRLDRQRDDVLPAFADRMLIVLGSAVRTPDGFATSDRGLVYLDRIDAGDGRVTDGSARLPGVRTWRAPCDHGRLVQDTTVLAACTELLSTGDTRLLPVAGPGRSHLQQDLLPSRPSRSGGRPPPPEAGLDPFALQIPGSATARGAANGPLQLQVLNSDLAFVDLPLLIGHYSSLGLTGSEAVVDRLLDGALSTALQAGVYPQQAGRHQVFLNHRLPADNPWQAPRPEAVVVIGLGPEGSLRPAALTGAVRDGVVAWALRLAEREDAPAHFALSATLLGSGGLNIDAGPCAQLIAQGVREAAERLATLSHPRRAPWPRPQRLVLVDLYLDRANEAWQALATLQHSRPQDFELEPAIHRTGSALDRPLDAGYRGADYDLVTATAQRDASGQPVIAYRIDTRRARAQVQAQATQGPLLERLLAAATETPGRTLFQLLVPPELQSFLSGATDTQIEVDQTTAAIPWELLEPPAQRGEAAARGPWALRARLLRKLRCEDLPWTVHDADRDEATLVIGEPACPPGYARLPGARREATAVAQALGAGRLSGGVRSLVADESGGPDAAAVVNALFERDWRIVHLCGHGEAPHEGDPRGVVLSDGVYLGPREIRNLRAVPELVFVNCCFSGARTASDGSARLPGFAANVAEQLIRGGVRCVVATGWAVADDAAQAFAQAFYASLLDGARFLDAVARGRAAAFAHGGSTWGAYQCYGDPDWRLRRGVADAQRPDAALSDPLSRIASVPALLLALRTLAVQAAYQGRRNEATPQLRALATRFEDRWGRRGDVAEAFGRAFDAVGDTRDALRWLERAVAAEDGRASLHASETLFNLRARGAWDRLWASRADERERAARSALRDIQAALDALQVLARLWPSSQRASLCGSAFKRMALVHALLGQPEEADRCVEAMCTHYRTGHELALAAPEGEPFYPAINLLAGTLASGRFDADESSAVQALAEAQRRRAPDFFNTAAAVELCAWQALAEGRLADELPALRLAFTDLHDRVADVSKWRSLHDQAWFVTGGWQRRQATPAAAQSEACNALMALLAAWAWPAADGVAQAPDTPAAAAPHAPSTTSTTTTTGDPP